MDKAIDCLNNGLFRHELFINIVIAAIYALRINIATCANQIWRVPELAASCLALSFPAVAHRNARSNDFRSPFSNSPTTPSSLKRNTANHCHSFSTHFLSFYSRSGYRRHSFIDFSRRSRSLSLKNFSHIGLPFRILHSLLSSAFSAW